MAERVMAVLDHVTHGKVIVSLRELEELKHFGVKPEEFLVGLLEDAAKRHGSKFRINKSFSTMFQAYTVHWWAVDTPFECEECKKDEGYNVAGS